MGNEFCGAVASAVHTRTTTLRLEGPLLGVEQAEWTPQPQWATGSRLSACGDGMLPATRQRERWLALTKTGA